MSGRRLIVPGEGGRHAAAPRRFAAALTFACAACLALALAGCGTKAPPAQDVIGEKELERPALPDFGWECETVEEPADRTRVGSLHGWKREGGSLVSVHGSTWGPAASGFYGHRTREAALAEALGSVVEAGLDALERRGVEFEPDRRLEILKDARSTMLRGEDPEFPRLRVAGETVERCRRRASGEMLWRVRISAEYPIGHLKGDVNNVNWARRRLEREADVVLGSARSYFDNERWLDGVRELARARRVLDEIADPSGEEVEHLAGEIDAIAREVLSKVLITPVRDVVVLEAGAPSDASLNFAVQYAWDGFRRPARGAPVVFEPVGWPPVLDPKTPADRDGVVGVTVRSAIGEVGEAAVVARLDDRVMRAVAAGLPGLDRALASRGTQAVFLVESVETEAVCLEVFGARDAAAATFLASCERRLERGGSALAPCDPDAAVAVRVELTVTSGEEAAGGWSVDVVASIAAFDQRSDVDLGSTTIDVREAAGTSGEAETLALKEAGRLVASYLDRRIVANRHWSER